MSCDGLPEPLRSGGGSGLHGDSVVQLYFFLKNLCQTVEGLDISQLQSDIADLQNTVSGLSGDIADLQDQINAIGEYAVPFQGQISVPSLSTVNITTLGTWTSTGISGVFDTDIDYGMSLGSVDTFGLKNTSGITRVGYFSASLSLDPAVGNNKELAIAFALDGLVINESIQKLFCKSGAEKADIYSSHIISVPNNSEVSVVVANFTDNGDIEIHNGVMACIRAQVCC